MEYLIFDEVDRIIELGLFDDLKEVLKYLLKDVVMKETADKNLKDLNKIRDVVEFNGQEIEVYDENEDNITMGLTEEEKKLAKFC